MCFVLLQGTLAGPFLGSIGTYVLRATCDVHILKSPWDCPPSLQLQPRTSSSNRPPSFLTLTLTTTATTTTTTTTASLSLLLAAAATTTPTLASRHRPPSPTPRPPPSTIQDVLFQRCFPNRHVILLVVCPAPACGHGQSTAHTAHFRCLLCLFTLLFFDSLHPVATLTLAAAVSLSFAHTGPVPVPANLQAHFPCPIRRCSSPIVPLAPPVLQPPRTRPPARLRRPHTSMGHRTCTRIRCTQHVHLLVQR